MLSLQCGPQESTTRKLDWDLTLTDPLSRPTKAQNLTGQRPAASGPASQSHHLRSKTVRLRVWDVLPGFTESRDWLLEADYVPGWENNIESKSLKNLVGKTSKLDDVSEEAAQY